jgi:FixJ family two-component response regulator
MHLSAPLVISVVDDDALVRTALSNVLLWRGYDVHTFGSGEELLESSRLDATSCIISDVQMSRMDGLELLSNIRTRGYITTPFIMITAFPDESVRARALEDGATAFLAKPFTMQTLIDCLDAALAGRDGGGGD